MSDRAGRHELILFDIDGTLIHPGGAGGKAMSRAFAQTCRVENGFAGIPLPGRTDAMILADAFAKHGLGNDPALLDRFRATYYRLLEEELARMPSVARVLPGVESYDVSFTRLSSARASATSAL